MQGEEDQNIHLSSRDSLSLFCVIHDVVIGNDKMFTCVCTSFLFEGKPTDFNYNNGTSLIHGSSNNALINASAANAGRTNFTNKQLTVGWSSEGEGMDGEEFCLGIGKRISFQSLFDSSTTDWNSSITSIKWNSSEGNRTNREILLVHFAL